MTIAEMCKLETSGGLVIGKVQWLRDLISEHGGFRRTSGWPMKSDAAGVHPTDALDAMKGAVKIGVPTEFDTKTGQAVFRDRPHRRAYLKAMGMHDRNGCYGD